MDGEGSLTRTVNEMLSLGTVYLRNNWALARRNAASLESCNYLFNQLLLFMQTLRNKKDAATINDTNTYPEYTMNTISYNLQFVRFIIVINYYGVNEQTFVVRLKRRITSLILYNPNQYEILVQYKLIINIKMLNIHMLPITKPR